MNVLMVGVDQGRIGGMWTVAETYINNKYYNKKVNLTYIATSTNGSIIRRILKMLSGLWQTFFYLAFKNVDLVHVHMAEKGSVYRKGIVVCFAKIFKRKVIIQLHAGPIIDWYSNLGDFRKKIVKMILNSGDKLLVLGEYWRQQLLVIVPKDKIEVIYNGTYCSAHNRYNPKGKYITFMGMITRKKGAYDLIDAILKIDNCIDDDIKVVFCGYDQDDKAKEYASMLNLEHRIIFRGWVDSTEKEKIFADTEVCVLPSYFEGLSMTVIESIAHGIPVITTNISTMPEIVGDKIHMIEPGDSNDLADTIVRITHNQGLRISQSNYLFDRAKKMFSTETNIKSTIDLYNECLE